MESRKTRLSASAINSLNPILMHQRALPLSPREQEVLGLVAKGLTYKEIGVELNIGVETVRTHVINTCKKMRVRGRVEAVAKYYSNATNG